jgi:hypothetical protein
MSGICMHMRMCRVVHAHVSRCHMPMCRAVSHMHPQARQTRDARRVDKPRINAPARLLLCMLPRQPTHTHTRHNGSDRLSEQFKTPAQSAVFWLFSGLWSVACFLVVWTRDMLCAWCAVGG